MTTWLKPDAPAENQRASHLHLDEAEREDFDHGSEGFGIAIDCTLKTHDIAFSGDL